MPYIAQRRMTVLGKSYLPGERVPAAAVGIRQLRSLLNRAYVIEVDDEDIEPADAGKKKLAKAGG